MDVLLVNGVDYKLEIKNPQIGQLILRDILKKKYYVECVNFDYLAKTGELPLAESIWKNVDLFTEYILNLNPRIVGFYTICNSFMTTLLMARKIKKERSDIKIIFGGPHATLTARECLEDFDCIDAICMGESEKTITPLVDALLEGEDLSRLKGVAFKKGHQIIITEREEMLANEDLINYTPFDYAPMKIDDKTDLELEAGRGCPFACTFCSTSPFWGRKFRIKYVDELITEMKKFNEMYGVTKFSLVHDMFTANRKHLIAFCNRIIDEQLPFKWGCSSRVDVLDYEILGLMKKANCISIYLGIETGSDSMQKKVNKNLDLNHALSIIRAISRLGMEFTTSFIYGYPRETVDEFRDTIKMIEEILITGNRNVQLHRFMLLPHTYETEGTFERAYFDDNDVDFSIYDEKLYDEEAKGIILKYPREFIQFYTFDSEVREKYKYFDSFLFYMTSGMGVYNCSIRYMIRKYGMEKMYFTSLESIKNAYKELRTMSIGNGAEIDSGIETIYKVVACMLENELEQNYTIELDQYYRYENLLREYAHGTNRTPKYYRFSFDVTKARKENIYEEKDCCVKFYFQNNKIRVAKVKIQESIISA